MKKKIYCFIILLMYIIFISIDSCAKYAFDNVYTAIAIDIDRKRPEIKIIEIENSNTENKRYANKTHVISVKIEIDEKNIVKNNFNKENIKILIKDKEVKPEIYEINELNNKQNKIIYEIKLKGLLEEGLLKIKIQEGTIVDKSNNFNLENIICTDIYICNTSSNVKFIEIRKDKV